MWAETREEASDELNNRVDELVKQHELNEEKVFVNRGDGRTCIFKQTLGFIYNSGLNQEQTLSIVEVPHFSQDVSLPTETVEVNDMDDDFKTVIGGDPVLD